MDRHAFITWSNLDVVFTGLLQSAMVYPASAFDSRNRSQEVKYFIGIKKQYDAPNARYGHREKAKRRRLSNGTETQTMPGVDSLFVMVMFFMPVRVALGGVPVVRQTFGKC